jgi:hypothetical protein
MWPDVINNENMSQILSRFLYARISYYAKTLMERPKGQFFSNRFVIAHLFSTASINGFAHTRVFVSMEALFPVTSRTMAQERAPKIF